MCSAQVVLASVMGLIISLIYGIGFSQAKSLKMNIMTNLPGHCDLRQSCQPMIKGHCISVNLKFYSTTRSRSNIGNTLYQGRRPGVLLICGITTGRAGEAGRALALSKIKYSCIIDVVWQAANRIQEVSGNGRTKFSTQ